MSARCQVNKAALVVVVVTLAACTGAAAKRTTTTATSPAVLWVDEVPTPALLSSLLPKPLPLPPPKTGAPACTAAALSVATVGGIGMSQNDGVVVRLRNTGRTACLLRGTPRVVASAPGQATVFATTAPMWPLGEIANTAPGGIVAVIINVPVACPADPGGGNIGLPVYHRLRISIPGGGNKKIGSLHLMFQCGMSTTPFFTPKPQPTYPPDPLVALIPHLQLPASVRAGTTLLYQVELVNPESRPVALSPCPVYLEWSDFPTKLAYRLNCRNTHPIAAHGQVRYQMEIAIPVSAPLGPAQVWWSLFGPSTHIGRGQVQVR